MAKDFVITANKLNKRKRFGRTIKLALLILLLFLIILFLILQVIYSEGKFTIILDANRKLEKEIALFESLDNKVGKRKLEATPIAFMDNISERWLPEKIDTEADGAHNGDNYIAYSFYLENQGKNTIDYWYEVVLDDVIKNVDEAIRIRIYHNGTASTYAKINSISKEPEEDTIAFKDTISNDEKYIIVEQRQTFAPGDIDHFTIVVWLEGDDKECTNALIGGELKMHMNITEEHTSV